jgi:hypothetical protein
MSILNQNTGDALFERTMDAANRAELISDMSTPAVKATQVLTGAVGDVSADETVTIGATVITIEDTASTANSIVKATDLSDDDTATSIKEFINGETPSATGVTFNGRTFAEAVTATKHADTVTITANVAGVAGNALASTETLTTGSFGAVTFTGGVNPVLNVNNITSLISTVGTYTLATVPEVGAGGGCIFVSDATGASLTGSLAYSNGTVWIDVTTGAAAV